MNIKKNILSETYNSGTDIYYKIITYNRDLRNSKAYELWRTRNKKGSKMKEYTCECTAIGCTHTCTCKTDGLPPEVCCISGLNTTGWQRTEA